MSTDPQTPRDVYAAPLDVVAASIAGLITRRMYRRIHENWGRQGLS